MQATDRQWPCNRWSRLLAVALLVLPVSLSAHSPPPEARLFFVNLGDGDIVDSPVTIEFGIEGFGIAPANITGKRRHYAGHHHLLIDVGLPADLDAPIPVDRNHLHFNQGERSVELPLEPGSHTLQLLLGDEEHEPQAPPLYSERITITVRSQQGRDRISK
jgi:hypothetical protein